MAFNISYIISAVDKFTAPMKSAEKAIAQVDKKTKHLNETQSKATKISANLAKTAGGMIAGYFSVQAVTDAVKKFSEFEDGLLELSAITGATGRDLDFLKSSAFELGKQFSKSGVEALDAFKLVASAKPELLQNIPALKAVTQEVLTLAAASGVELSQAANYTAQTLNIFGAGADQAARFVNVLAAESKFGASEVADTGEALLKAGQSAKLVGFSIERTTAAIEMLARGGIKGSEAGVGLNATLLRLQVNSKKFGIDMKNMSLDQSLGLVKEKLDRIKDPAKRAEVAMKLFGMEHIKTGEALLANVGKFDAFEKSITGTNTATEQAKIRLASLSNRFKAFGTALDEKLITLMSKLAPVFDMFADQIDNILKSMTPDAINGFAGALSFVGVVLGTVAAAISGLIQFLALLFEMISKVGKVFGLLGAEIASGGKFEFFQELKSIFSGTESTATIDVNINDKGGNVGAVTSQSSGGNVNVGRNMAGAY